MNKWKCKKKYKSNFYINIYKQQNFFLKWKTKAKKGEKVKKWGGKSEEKKNWNKKVQKKWKNWKKEEK